MSAHSGLIYLSITDRKKIIIDVCGRFYSAKMANKVETILKPLLGPGSKYEGKVKVIIRLHVQSWHASSTLTHEAALAVSSLLLTVIYLNSCFLINPFERFFVHLLITSGHSVSKSVPNDL